MKGPRRQSGYLSRAGARLWLRWPMAGSSSAYLSMAFYLKDEVAWEAVPAAQFDAGSSCDQRDSGACRGERFVLREDMPDGLGQLAGDVDAGNLRATLAAKAVLGPLVAIPIADIAGSVSGSFDQRPAQARHLGDPAAPAICERAKALYHPAILGCPISLDRPAPGVLEVALSFSSQRMIGSRSGPGASRQPKPLARDGRDRGVRAAQPLTGSRHRANVDAVRRVD